MRYKNILECSEPWHMWEKAKLIIWHSQETIKQRDNRYSKDEIKPLQTSSRHMRSWSKLEMYFRWQLLQKYVCNMNFPSKCISSFFISNQRVDSKIWGDSSDSSLTFINKSNIWICICQTDNWWIWQTADHSVYFICAKVIEWRVRR